MKFYKIMAITAVSVFLSVSAVQADTVADITVADDGTSACLTGVVDIPGLGFADAQIKNRIPYYPLQIAAAIYDIETGERIYTNQIQAEDDGSYSAKFIMNAEKGIYRVVLSTAYGRVYEGEVEYKDGTVDKFNDISESGSTDELMAFVNSYNRYMGIDLSLFSQFTDEEKQQVLEAVMKNAPNSTKADVRANFSDEVFNVGLTTETLSDGDKSRMFNEYMDSLGEEYEKIASFINENSLGADIISLFNTGKYESVKKNIYDMSLKMYLTNRLENIYDIEILFREDNLFSIPENDFKKYQKLEKKTAFYTALYNESGSIDDLQAFYSAVSKSIKTAENKSNEGNSNSSSGSGGSGGSGGSTRVSGPAVTVPQQNNTGSNVNNGGTEIYYSDLSSFGWAQTAVYELSKIGAVNGSESGEFMPGDSITREQFAKIAALSFGIKESADNVKTFTDVNDGEWYSSYVRALSSNGIINGIPDGSFGVGKPITRQDAAAILSKILSTDAETSENGKFTDDEQIAQYAKAGVYALKNGGMISGYDDGSFRPLSNITRAEAAQMIYNILKLGKGV